jgi:hypothetical protein
MIIYVYNISIYVYMYDYVFIYHAYTSLQGTIRMEPGNSTCCRKAPKLRIAPHATGPVLGWEIWGFGSCLWNWRFPIQIVEFSDNLIIWDGNYMYITCPLESLEVKVLAAMGTTWKGEAKHLWSLRQQNQCHKHLEKTTAINLAWLLILGLIIGFTTLHVLPRIIINDEIMILTDTVRLRNAPL